MPRTITSYAERRTSSRPFLVWINHRWQSRQRAARRLRPRTIIGHVALWLCIHRGEGAWDDGGYPYYGGLQMTAGWYGGRGHLASSDPPAVQMAAAEHQYKASHYSIAWLEGKWPNTSPPCLGYR